MPSIYPTNTPYTGRRTDPAEPCLGQPYRSPRSRVSSRMAARCFNLTRDVTGTHGPAMLAVAREEVSVRLVTRSLIRPRIRAKAAAAAITRSPRYRFAARDQLNPWRWPPLNRAQPARVPP